MSSLSHSYRRLHPKGTYSTSKNRHMSFMGRNRGLLVGTLVTGLKLVEVASGRETAQQRCTSWPQCRAVCRVSSVVVSDLPQPAADSSSLPSGQSLSPSQSQRLGTQAKDPGQLKSPGAHVTEPSPPQRIHYLPNSVYNLCN